MIAATSNKSRRGEGCTWVGGGCGSYGGALCMCVVAAELRLLLLHAAAELCCACCVLYDAPHYY